MNDLAVLGGDVDVVVRDGRIVDGPAPDGVPVLDASGCVVASTSRRLSAGISSCTLASHRRQVASMPVQWPSSR